MTPTEYGFDAQPWHAEILCSRHGEKPRSGKPHYHFFVDAKATGAGGEAGAGGAQGGAGGNG